MGELAKRRAPVLLGLLLFLSTCPRELAGQSRPAQKDRPISRIVYDGDMSGLLAKLAQEFNVNIGLEVYPWRPTIPVKVELSDPTIADVLDAVVSSAPRYRWREVEGGYEVSPEGAGCPLLDTRVEEFNVGGVTQAEAVEQLMNLPEVRSGMTALNLRYEARPSRPTRQGGERFSLSVRGASLRQVLHQIAGKSGGRFWGFGRYGNQSDGEVVTLRTPGMW
ncbi:MAG: hypothetical protein ABW208_14600 [Pyrinomonadaceae bacterium]